MSAAQVRTTLTIPDFKINSLATFNDVTADPRQIAGLYFFEELDCLVELAYLVAMDFFRKPHLYVNLHGLAPILATLRARLGSHEKLPDQSQRLEIFQPIFGSDDDASMNANASFPFLRDNLNQAAAAFSERVFDTGVEMLRERVRTTHRPFKEYLTGLNGDSSRWSREALAELTEEVSYKILRNPGVASVFGISKEPKDAWPYDLDSNGDKLVEAISSQLMPNEHHITRQRISNVQRNALRGAEAIATIVTFDESKADNNEDLSLLITKCYTWGSALMNIGRQTVTAQMTNGSIGSPESYTNRKQPLMPAATAAFRR